MAASAFIDTHYHIWDVTDPASTHSAAVLGGPGELHPSYTTQMYLDDMKKTNKVLKAGVFVEALPGDCVKELSWVRQAAANGVPHAIVARADLTEENIDETLAQLTASSTGAPVRGIRQILNFKPTWPFVKHAKVITTPEFERGFALLAKHKLSFDLHINPYQMLDAAALFSKYPQIPVIINHLGCPKLTADRPAADVIGEWRAGMTALANAGPHVFLKLSMFVYVDSAWDSAESPVKGMVLEMVKLFGPQRCMLATNYPVDKQMGVSPEQFAAGTDAILAELDDEAKKSIYYGTAAQVYGINVE